MGNNVHNTSGHKAQPSTGTPFEAYGDHNLQLDHKQHGAHLKVQSSHVKNPSSNLQVYQYYPNDDDDEEDQDDYSSNYD